MLVSFHFKEPAKLHGNKICYFLKEKQKDKYDQSLLWPRECRRPPIGRKKGHMKERASFETNGRREGGQMISINLNAFKFPRGSRNLHGNGPGKRAFHPAIFFPLPPTTPLAVMCCTLAAANFLIFRARSAIFFSDNNIF